MSKAKEQLSEQQIKKIVSQVTTVGVFGNVVLAAFKLFAGLIGHSTAMVSDAVHSLSDVFATLIAFIGLKISARDADKEHPYGHERMECLASIMLALVLIVTGLKIGVGCLEAILDKSYLTAAQPGVIALVAAIVSIVVKEGMFWYTMIEAKRINSSVFAADAWHHRSDALSSVGALIGIGAARLGFPIMDSVAGIIICLVILYVGYEIMKDAIDKLLDTAAEPETEEGIRKAIEKYAADEKIQLGIDSLITRRFGQKLYVDLEISVDGDMKLNDAHDISEKVHDVVEHEFKEVKHVMVHMNPAGYHYEVRA